MRSLGIRYGRGVDRPKGLRSARTISREARVAYAPNPDYAELHLEASSGGGSQDTRCTENTESCGLFMKSDIATLAHEQKKHYEKQHAYTKN